LSQLFGSSLSALEQYYYHKQMGLVNEVELKSLLEQETDSPQTNAASLMEQGSLRERRAKAPRNSVVQSFKIVILSNKLNLLLPFGPLAILVHYLTDNKVRNCSSVTNHNSFVSSC